LQKNTEMISYKVRYLDIVGEKGKRERGRAAASIVQCKAVKLRSACEISRSLTTATSTWRRATATATRRPDHWDAEIVPAMVSTSATYDDDYGSTSGQRWPWVDFAVVPLSRPLMIVESLDHVLTTSVTTGTCQWTVDLTVLSQCTRVTDRQTDGQTDRQNSHR